MIEIGRRDVKSKYDEGAVIYLMSFFYYNRKIGSNDPFLYNFFEKANIETQIYLHNNIIEFENGSLSDSRFV